MSKRLGGLVGGSLLFWGLVAYPAYLLGGESGLVFSAVAGGLCLLPGLATLLAAEWAYRRSPDVYLMVVLAGTALRLVVVLGGCLAVRLAWPVFQDGGFLLWVGICYLFTMALEMTLLLTGRTNPAGPHVAGGTAMPAEQIGKE